MKKIVTTFIFIACMVLVISPMLIACSKDCTVKLDIGQGGTVEVRIGDKNVTSGKSYAKGSVLMIRVNPDATQKVKSVEAGKTALVPNQSGTYTHALTSDVTIKVVFEAGCACTCLTGGCPCPFNCPTCIQFCDCTCDKGTCPCPSNCPTCMDPLDAAKFGAIFVLALLSWGIEDATVIAAVEKAIADILKATTVLQVNTAFNQVMDVLLVVIIDNMADTMLDMCEYIDAKHSVFDNFNRDKVQIRVALKAASTAFINSYDDLEELGETEQAMRTFTEAMADAVASYLGLNKWNTFSDELFKIMWAMENCWYDCGYKWCLDCTPCGGCGDYGCEYCEDHGPTDPGCPNSCCGFGPGGGCETSGVCLYVGSCGCQGCYCA